MFCHGALLRPYSSFGPWRAAGPLSEEIPTPLSGASDRLRSQPVSRSAGTTV